MPQPQFWPTDAGYHPLRQLLERFTDGPRPHLDSGTTAGKQTQCGGDNVGDVKENDADSGDGGIDGSVDGEGDRHEFFP